MSDHEQRQQAWNLECPVCAHRWQGAEGADDCPACHGKGQQGDLQEHHAPRYYQDVAGEEDYIDVTESIEYLRQERRMLICALKLIAAAGTARDNGWWFHETATTALNNLKESS